MAYSLLLPWSYGSSGAETGETPRVVSVISMILQRLVTLNDEKAMSGGSSGSRTALTRFHGLRAPAISVSKYLERIFKYANCSPSCFVVAYIYIDRFLGNLQQLGIGACITSLNVHRLLITGTVVAAKFMDDVYHNNAYYAKVGGISTSEMNQLELEFLFRIGFKLNVTLAAFESYCLHLQREVLVLEVERPLVPCFIAGTRTKPQKRHHQPANQSKTMYQFGENVSMDKLCKGLNLTAQIQYM
eukprot:TRINITY_DN8731_c0_g1_i1.p1 TRINITY_DN8731_c0_g1~~TRINITY_DN8731_c0_g1_i1.p1  ORF type:complete len:270 (+),score=34.18 TRINITY_DN8731_c0_g1_i1:79-810(+)